MTEQKTRLISLNYQTLWEATNFNISIVENRKPQDPLLQLLHKEQRVVILPKSGKSLHEYFHRKIKESRPSEAEQFSKDNQPVQRVLGQCVLVQFTYENVVLHTIYSTKLSIQNRGIQIDGEKCIHFTCPMGAKVQIEVPKKEGRYRFSSIITEQYLQTPDPVGKYYITLAVPSNISLFNDRAAYRAPMPMPLEMSVLVLPPYDTEREKPQEFFNLAKEQHTIIANLHDISISGMGFFLPSSIKAYQVPMHRLVMRCSLDLHGEKIILQGIPKYELSLQDQKRDNELNNYRVGMEFVNINNFERSLINRTVLKIEREQIRKEQEKKQEST
jgi:c-di-GMP-binding flagellar brake protein YcgR